MPKHVMVVFVGPKAGREDEFNAFQTSEHVPDVLGAKGLTHAQRFRLADEQPAFASDPPAPAYLTLYAIEADDIGAAIRSLESDRESGRWRVSDAHAPSRVCAVYTAVSEVIPAPEPE